MNKEYEILRLIDLVRSLEDRVRDLEADVVEHGEDAIGFDIANDEDDFDSDETEYRTTLSPIEVFMHNDRLDWNHGD